MEWQDWHEHPRPPCARGFNGLAGRAEGREALAVSEGRGQQETQGGDGEERGADEGGLVSLGL